MTDAMRHYSENLLELLRTGEAVQIVFHEPGMKNSPDDTTTRFAITCGDRYVVHMVDPKLIDLHKLGRDVATVLEMATAFDRLVRAVREHGTKAPKDDA